MAKSLNAFTYKNGFKQPAIGTPWRIPKDETEEHPDWVCPPDEEHITSRVHNELGINKLRTWPTMYNGTNSPQIPEWFNKPSEVDVLICGAGPSGLEVAVSLIRQGISFRIIDKAEAPLLAGRADGVQPRFLETLNQWGLAEEVHEEGPIIERTAIYKDGEKVFFGRSHQSDSRYRGLHIITQGQVERIYIRDLYRHKKLVERSTTVKNFEVAQEGDYPVTATLLDEKTGKEEAVRAKFLVGSDGAASTIRKQLEIPFDGCSTDIYWGIMDCVFETDYPHAWMFGSVISSQHGGCVIIPREDGYIRLYTQLDTSATGPLARSRQANDPSFKESGGNVDIHSITAEEVLEQANKIFFPYKLTFAAPLSWFAIWKISERVARQYSKYNRVHLVGDAAHVHSVMGAFGLNASILDAANLAWKLGACARGIAKLESLMPTYEAERRRHAVRIIETSGTYLRFICGSKLPVVNLSGIGTEPREDEKNYSNGIADPAKDIENPDLAFLVRFFSKNGAFLLGVDAPYGNSVINPPRTAEELIKPPISVKNGVRAPNPRVCFETGKTGYLYDSMTGASKFNLVVFGSNLRGPIREKLAVFSAALARYDGFYKRFGGQERFRVLLVVKCQAYEVKERLIGEDLKTLKEEAQLVFDDRAPDEDAHVCYEVDHARGAVAVVRPDLWLGLGAFPDDTDRLMEYFKGFLVDV
ncbi:FAD binding domain-containing protein [Pyronema omphalodes]|nr:FAD binding domain-containing protein [Pyronema omphalodes]